MRPHAGASVARTGEDRVEGVWGEARSATARTQACVLMRSEMRAYRELSRECRDLTCVEASPCCHVGVELEKARMGAGQGLEGLGGEAGQGAAVGTQGAGQGRWRVGSWSRRVEAVGF